MADQPAPPPKTPLSPRDDKETLAILDGLDVTINTLETQVNWLKEQRLELREHLGNRIAGDLRPRIHALQDTTKKQETRLTDLEKKAGVKK